MPINTELLRLLLEAAQEHPGEVSAATGGASWSPGFAPETVIEHIVWLHESRYVTAQLDRASTRQGRPVAATIREVTPAGRAYLRRLTAS